MSSEMTTLPALRTWPSGYSCTAWMNPRHHKEAVISSSHPGALTSPPVGTGSRMSVNFTGTWKASLSHSRLLGPTPKAITALIDHSDVALREELVVTKLDGGEDRIVFTCRIDDQAGGSLNGTPVRGIATWEGTELVIESWIQLGAREAHFCDYWSLSRDGQVLSMEHRRGDLLGQLTIFNRTL